MRCNASEHWGHLKFFSIQLSLKTLALVAATEAHGVIFDQVLSPAQQRNL